MQWIEHTETSNLHTWTLEGKQQIASLSFTPGSKSFRLLYASQRLFFLEDNGILQQKIALKSEYGVSLGEIHPQHYGQDGTILLNQTKYYFTKSDTGYAIFDKTKNLIANLGVACVHALNIFERSSLLFAFAWIFPAIQDERTYLLFPQQQTQ